MELTFLNELICIELFGEKLLQANENVSFV